MPVTHVRNSRNRFAHPLILITLLFSLMMFAGCLAPARSFDEGKAPSASMEEYKNIARTMVHGVAAGLGNTLADMNDKDERIELIRAFITPVRFYPDESGYFYVYDFQCVNIAHAINKDLQGQNLYDHKDVKGTYVIRALSEAANNGGGFVDYYWVKPGSAEESPKLGYVEPIPNTDYFIGTGVYLP